MIISLLISHAERLSTKDVAQCKADPCSAGVRNIDLQSFCMWMLLPSSYIHVFAVTVAVNSTRTYSYQFLTKRLNIRDVCR